MKTFTMPAAQPLEPMALPARRAVKSPTLAFPRATGFKVGSVPEPVKRPAKKPVQASTAQVANSKYDVNFVVATPTRLPGLFGDTILLCARENVSLTRFDAGLLCFAVDHDESQLIGVVKALTFKSGKVYGAADYLDGALATRIRSEIDQGARRGISPAFLVFDYDVGKDDSFTITKWEPYEVSTTAIPRNPDALILDLGRQPMSLQEATAPDIQTTSDLTGLSLSLGRQALRDGKGTPEQRERLTAFFGEFDKALSRGLPRDMAVTAAKSRAAG